MHTRSEKKWCWGIAQRRTKWFWITCVLTPLVVAVAVHLLGRLVRLDLGRRGDRQYATAAHDYEGREIVLGQPIDLQVSSGKGSLCSFSADSDQYLHLVVERGDEGIEVVVTGPSGLKLADVRSWRYGPLEVSLVSRTSGTHYCEVISLEPGAPPWRGTLRVTDSRPSTILDGDRVEAERAYAEAEGLRGEFRESALRRAIVLYQRCAVTWQRLQDSRREARSLVAIADARYVLGEYKPALDYYEKALSVSRSAGNDSEAILSLNGIARTEAYLDNVQECLARANEALLLSRASGDRRGAAEALNNVGKAYYYSSDMPKALEFFNEALPVWVVEGDRRGQAQTLSNIGYAFYDLRDPHRAIEYYERATDLWRSVDDRGGIALALTALGGAYSYLGEKEFALSCHEQAAEVLRDIGNRSGEAAALNGIGYLYEDLAEHDRALEAYGRAFQLFREIGDRVGESLANLYIGRVCHSLADYKGALKSYHKVLSLRPVNYRITSAYAFNCIGMVYGALRMSSKALSYYNRALELNRAVRDQMGEAYALNNIGYVYYELGNKQRALAYFKRALVAGQAAQDNGVEILTLYNIARVERDLRHLFVSLSRIEASITLIESLRTRVNSRDLRTSYFASMRQHYELYVDVLMQLHEQHPRNGFDRAALQASERARSRSFLDMLAEARTDIRQGVDSALLEKDDALQRELSDKQRLHIRLLVAGRDRHDIAESERVLDDLLAKRQDVQMQIRANSPRYALLTQPEAVGLSEVQQELLDGDTVLLEYLLGDERSYLWVVTQSTLSSYRIPPRQIIETAAKGVYELMSTCGRPTRASARARDADYSDQAEFLSSMLLGPVQSQLGTKRLVIAADGALLYVPFSALPVRHPYGKGGSRQQSLSDVNPLLCDHEVVCLPSVSAWAMMRRQAVNRKPAEKAVAIFADPVMDDDDPRVGAPHHRGSPAELHVRSSLQRTLRDFGATHDRASLSRLAFSNDEARAIMSFAPQGECLDALGFRANLSTAMSAEIRQYRIVHFATHGLLDDKHPELSGMVLSLLDEVGNEQNGFLGLQDIYNMNLSADLVVLSACQTGLGKLIRGEGLVGLTRGFMYAGAPRVVASLWKVDDEATAELMSKFYRKMLSERQRPAAALRESQIEMWRMRRWKAPYYWAAFILEGEFS